MVLVTGLKEEYGRLKLYIDGQWKESKSERTQPIYDPGKGVPIGEVPFALKEEVDEAVQTAVYAFDKWSQVPITERVKYLFRMKQVFEEHLIELAAVNTQNHGKTLEESKGDLRRAIDNIDSAISVAYTLAKGENLDQISPGIDEYMVKEPLGVFGIICPFNFPIMIPFWFIPYAIVLGNTVVIKPSEITPIPMDYVMHLLEEEVKLPSGVINMVHGSKETVEAIISHKDIQGVTFVGSSPVAKYVYKLAGEHGKRVIAQGGAKNSIVVMPDADLSLTIPAAISSFFGNTGQRCLAGANLIPIGKIHEEVVRKFSSAAGQIKIGHGLDEKTQMGPLVNERAKNKVIGYIEKGLEEGAKPVLDGKDVKIDEYPLGFYLGPTIFDEVSPDMAIARDEIFGPVASVIHAENLDEAIEVINKNTNYGNMACIFTTSGRNAREFRRRVNAGNIGINLGVAAPAANFPFAGRRESFYGILHAQIDTVEFFTDKKVIIERW
ncbi:MAG TPA: CoA-acylating methylmalonate-semialdehyde dehydrogenase [Candidatus Caldiarchaeum subterraneum]|uniref:methylmalonate-semialdehyde dehydrogenase (CoA acylating) n=1 Tax=Caldiarchaeum subterraneum TaxID=311458 RepID=A0A832ZX61_CALS0|nr:CoA-acylating methylmalonate-semialdehyde dehydrogenase [Candidatus Caldarchaeum subterraneum]